MNNELKCNCLEEEKNIFNNSMIDNVNHPKHYENASIECYEAMLITFGPQGYQMFCLGNAYKYLWRYKNKNGSIDLDKAEWYLDSYKQLHDKCLASYEYSAYESLRSILKNHKEKLHE